MDTPNHPPLLTTHKQRDGVSSLNPRRYNCTASQAALRTAVQQARCPSSPTSRESKTQRAGANPAAHCGAWRDNSFPSPIEQQRPIQQGTTQTQQRPATNTACHNCMNHAAPAAALAICLCCSGCKTEPPTRRPHQLHRHSLCPTTHASTRCVCCQSHGI
jgi:hypothetical protein